MAITDDEKLMGSNKNIACELYDYLEIVCLYAYQVRLTLDSGETFAGVAKTIKIENKKEWLVIETDIAQQQKIETNKLKIMEVLTQNAKFARIVF